MLNHSGPSPDQITVEITGRNLLALPHGWDRTKLTQDWFVEHVPAICSTHPIDDYLQ